MQTRILSWAKKQRVSEVTNMNRSDHIIRNMFCWCLCLLLVFEKWFFFPSELWHFPLTRNEKVCLLLCEYKTFDFLLTYFLQPISYFSLSYWHMEVTSLAPPCHTCLPPNLFAVIRKYWSSLLQRMAALFALEIMWTSTKFRLIETSKKKI